MATYFENMTKEELEQWGQQNAPQLGLRASRQLKAEMLDRVREHFADMTKAELEEWGEDHPELGLNASRQLKAEMLDAIAPAMESEEEEEPDIILDESEDEGAPNNAPRRNWARVARTAIRATGALLLAGLVLVIAVAAAPRGFRAVRNWVAPQPTPAVVVDTDEQQDVVDVVDAPALVKAELDTTDASVAPAWAAEEEAEAEEEEEEILLERPSVGDTLDVEGEEALVVAEVLIPARLAYADLRAENPFPGDTAAYVIRFTQETWGPLTLLRAVPDDEFISLEYCQPSGCIDLLPLLGMTEVTESEPSGSIRDYMVARGMEDEAQQLPQNTYSVQIDATEEAWLEVVMKDDPTKGVNRGGLVSFSSDTDPFTWVQTDDGDGYELAEEMASFVLEEPAESESE